ncbi:MAG: Periplasmic pH-dependent serine endoprotease DegQ [Chlamydiae bacterium]|nr:Periplasmic pH-dependent serine endoprotease DegQ [Chlamydiota bacterium]
MRIIAFLFVSIFSLTLCAASNDCACTPQQISKVFTSVAKEATPAVVYIKAEGVGDQDDLSEQFQSPGQSDPFGDDFFNRFFGSPNRKAPKQSISQGSGFFVNSDGHILTNAHVVKGANKITVILNDGREMIAEIIGTDSSTDIAVIKVDGKNFPFLTFGDSEEMEVGEWVMAIGSPFQLQASVTVGVISAKGRQNLRITDFEDFIQTDAAINPGNSGGPLVNLEAKVIGINTAIVSKSGGYMGIGFAIPSNMAKHIMNQIIDNGNVIRGFLGVSLQPIDQDMADAFGLEKPEGALVAEVVKGSPADKAGLKQGDIITQYDNTPVKSIGSFRNEISMTKPGTKITLKVNRNGKYLTIPVTLTSHSDDASAGGYIQKLGLDVEPLTPDLAKKLGYSQTEEGVVITKIKPGSAAAMAGMRPGFLILAINHKKVTTVEEFNKALEETKKNRLLILAKQGNVTRFYSLKIE